MGVNLCVGHNPEFKVDTSEWITGHATRLLLSRNVAPPVALPLDTVACGDVLSAEAVLSSPWGIYNSNVINVPAPGIVVLPNPAVYSLSMYVHMPAAGNWLHGVRLALSWFTAAGVYITITNGVLVTVSNAGFERFLLENKSAPINAGLVIPIIAWDTDALGNHLYYTAVQLELGPVATAYDPGVRAAFPPRFW